MSTGSTEGTPDFLYTKPENKIALVITRRQARIHVAQPLFSCSDPYLYRAV